MARVQEQRRRGTGPSRAAGTEVPDKGSGIDMMGPGAERRGGRAGKALK